MTKRGGFLEEISRELNIPRGAEEQVESWYARIVYSISGRMALVSLWDIQEDSVPVSITHFKRRIEKTLYAYRILYPEICNILPKVTTEFCDSYCNEIYRIYLESGQIYHAPQRIAPPIETAAGYKNIRFIRGAAPSHSIFFSGLGGYTIVPLVDKPEAAETVKQMFQLQEDNLSNYWNSVFEKAKWVPFDIISSCEFVNTKPPFTTGYWSNSLNSNSRVSVMRINTSNSYLYYLLRQDEGQTYASQLAEWQVLGGKSRHITNAFLKSLNILPPTKYHFDGEIVHLQLQYLLPALELNFLRLYSWPESFLGLPHDFNRIMSREVFFSIKSILETIGYQFIEV